jgi:hypothetical protein
MGINKQDIEALGGEMDYAKIVTRAWDVIWKHKILWVFGIISGLIGNAYGYSSYFRFDVGAVDLSEWTYPQMPYPEEFIRVIRWGSDNLALFVLGIVLVVLFFILLTNAFFAFGYSGTIHGNLLAAQGAEKLSFGDIVNQIWPYFWRIFGLYLLLGVGGFGVVVMLFGILTVIGILTIGIGFICLFPLICLLVPLSWFLMIVVNIALVAIIAEDLSIKDGLVRGWRMVTGNLGPFILIWLIIVVISFIAGIVISLPQTIAMGPAYRLMFSPKYLSDPSIFFEKINEMLPWMLAWSPFMIVLQGIITTYTQSAWVQAYLEVRENGTLEAPDQPEEVDPEPDQLEQTT